MKEHAYVLMRYNLTSERKVWKDKHSPTLASIATLRAVNKKIKIYVLDSEPLLEDWGDFPSLLDFHVVQLPNQMPIPYDGGHPFQRRMVSRIWDLWHFARLIPERYIVYGDSDIFWLRDPFPLENRPVSGFYGDTRGDGFFYFDRHSLDTEVFVNCWRGLTLAGTLSDEIRTMMRVSGYHSPMYTCEMPYCYLIRCGMTWGWRPVGRLEHYFPNNREEAIEPTAKCLHAHSGLFGSDRLRVAREVIEFNRAIRGVLPSETAALLLGECEGSVSFTGLADLYVKR